MKQIILTVMCMVYNNEEVLMINRNNDWPGFTFPGGHVEPTEPIVDAVKREILEETGLTIYNPLLIGIREWYDKNSNIRNVGILFKTSQYTGNTIKETNEGKISWTKIKDLNKLKLAFGFEQELPLFLENKWTEIYSSFDSNENKYKFIK